ncbi:hypothetical protein [Cohaesibacter gelatinilyticus]|uniref:Uncharacterized protein n=1 Tax=Cohaesibacter gelatinilyticus TaxID=372072 RepID=A0A285PCE7_9HYPH|nr:hypothetical protein [Cohaesibacter gelatinilyticus]SNZ19399.1 hypothetical protein SAMN06265368_2484 [Cohaesibacter gelatinilyticus]
MTEFVSTATMRNDSGKLVYMRSKREASDTDTQARKAATRYWNGIADARGWELDRVYCVRRGSCGFVVSERRMDRRDWTRYLAPETPTAQVQVCIEELGGEPPTQPPPETMTINGWIYQRGEFLGEV